MCFETIFIDLDDTLYPATCGLYSVLSKRMELYMVERMQISPETAPKIRQDLFQKYGTTYRGLTAVYKINEDDFMDYVHNIPLSPYLHENLELRETLELYPQRKVIFTNADTPHAKRVIKALGLEGLFEQIIDIHDISPYYKPQMEAFQKALQLAGVKNPGDCVMIDDTKRNLLGAKEAGLFTIQAGVRDRPTEVDAAIMTLLDLPNVIPV
jgi:pyrimidine 5'-nucleotidase